ncbi:hypothetical protein AB0E69_15275 [Kribbella sp. NPDC026611]|uniref:hypothetical protein n=1 Tax=Kribbella sp. NPDC026611 TaxID=3154911 RepID=UPI0033BFBA6C
MQGDFLMQKFEGIFGAGTGYKAVGGAQGETASDHLSTVTAAGGNWLSPEFHELHGNVLRMTNDTIDEAHRTGARGDAVINCGDLGVACSNNVMSIVSAV